MKMKLERVFCVAACSCMVFSSGCSVVMEPPSVNISISNGSTDGESEENNNEKTGQSKEDDDGPAPGGGDKDDYPYGLPPNSNGQSDDAPTIPVGSSETPY
jgi:hypothetical protein